MKKCIKTFIPEPIKKFIKKSINHRPIKSNKESIFVGKPIKDIFTEIYKMNYWKGDQSISGTGSDMSQVQVIIKQLNPLIKKFNIKTVLDLPCGDFSWMKYVNLNDVNYLGIDVVEELITNNINMYSKKNIHFKTKNLIIDSIPKCDLIINRDCLVHFSFIDIYKSLQNIKQSQSKFLLTTTFTNRHSNIDICTGEWRPLNLNIIPFNFPEPKLVINENCTEENYAYEDKSLALYLIDEIDLPHSSFNNN